jgi:hypothetical protein
MEFRYKDPSGKVVVLADVTLLIHAIRDGLVRPDTPFSVGDGRYWHRAENVPAYQEASAILKRVPKGHVMLSTLASPELQDKARQLASAGLAVARLRPPRLMLAGVGLVMLLGVLILKPWSASEASGGASAAERTAALMKAQLAELEAGYGRSFARNVWRGQDWLRGMKLEDRFQGPALKSLQSLREIHEIARGIRTGADSLVPAADRMARWLEVKADSIEGVEKRLAGLAPALEDRLALWREDVQAYTRMQYDFANTLEALSEFLRSHQQGFAIQNGRPFFMSRTDGQEYRELLDELTVHVNRERAWSDGLQERHPGWLTSLPETERPRFGEPLFSRK